jgi:hypothetical protein
VRPWRTASALVLVASTIATAVIARALMSGPPPVTACLSVPPPGGAETEDRFDGGGGVASACRAAGPVPSARNPWAGVSLALQGTAAAAIPVRGTEGRDRLNGTPFGDNIEGLGGDDRIFGAGGPDLLDGGLGRDVIRGGAGTDLIVGEGDAARDDIGCGEGADTVSAGLGDAVALDCETVSRELSHDPSFDFQYQHQTQAEPDSFANGRTIVAVYQVGRAREGGGAAATGFATSVDAGTTWRSGLLPSLTLASRPPGIYDRSSDPAVTYDARHSVWLAASLILSDEGTGIVVSRSKDGLAWLPPVVASPGTAENPDKDWVVCDNWAGSPGRGTCYLAYYDVNTGLAVRTSSDGGLTWSGPILTPARVVRGAIMNGATPVVRRDGSLLVIYSVFQADRANVDEIAYVRSNDHGGTFSGPTRLAPLSSEDVSGLRVPPFVSADVAGDGKVWVAWSDCRFDPDCTANDIVLTSSADGTHWALPIRVPAFRGGLVQLAQVLPGLTVDPASTGAKTKLGIVYYSVPPDGGCLQFTCATADVNFVGSFNAGTTWTRPVRLNPRPMRLDWMADGEIGSFVGDYVSSSWVGGRPIPVVVLARPPVDSELRQAVFAATRIPRFPAVQLPVVPR